MMKTSFSTLACPDWSLKQALQAAVNYGYDGVELRVLSNELDLWKLPEFQPSARVDTRKQIDDHGILIPCVGTSACFHSPELIERQRNFDAALRMAELAAELDASSIRVFGDRVQSGCSREESAKWIADSLIELSERLRPEKVEVWLETHGDFATAAGVNEILGQIDEGLIGLIWDPANAFAQIGEAPLISNEMTTRIRHVHLKDLRRNVQHTPQYVPTGEGEFPFKIMFESLALIDYEDFISFEWEKHWHPELAPPQVALPSFIEWWKSRRAS
jgi:sugar phosphate isomerase/epimerase